MAAPQQEEISRDQIIGQDVIENIMRLLSQDMIHRKMRAENLIYLNFSKERPLGERLLFENEDFMSLWHTALAYIDKPEEMGEFMSNPNLHDKLLGLMVQGGNFWWTPMGFCLWKCLSPDSLFVAPCYYCQYAFVWGVCCPLSACSKSCYGALIGPLAPETKRIDERKVAALAKIFDDAEAKVNEILTSNPELEFSKKTSEETGLKASEIIRCALLSEIAYLPTTEEKKEKVLYNVFVPLVRERMIESRANQGHGDAQESLDSFVKFFYTPQEPDTDGKFGHGKPIGKVLETIGLEVVKGFDIYATDTQGYIAKSSGFDENGGDVVIAFRGTTSVNDWITNISYRFVSFDPEKKGITDCGEVHGGFYKAFLSALPFIQKHALPLIESGKPCRIIIAGHSLGGGLSTLACGYFRTHFAQGLPSHISEILTVNFGSPKVGKKDFVEFLEKGGPQFRSFRLHNQKDPVPYTPPTSFGFQHAFIRAVISPSGRIFFSKDEDDSSTKALSGAIDFHDIFNYADATFQFKTKCEKMGLVSE